MSKMMWERILIGAVYGAAFSGISIALFTLVLV